MSSNNLTGIYGGSDDPCILGYTNGTYPNGTLGQGNWRRYGVYMPSVEEKAACQAPNDPWIWTQYYGWWTTAFILNHETSECDLSPSQTLGPFQDGELSSNEGVPSAPSTTWAFYLPLWLPHLQHPSVLFTKTVLSTTSLWWITIRDKSRMGGYCDDTLAVCYGNKKKLFGLLYS
ncbi:hypothetical protein PCANC_17351 [Puccinia coronata f. sp. avenae]|uniref:Uncharacterized protein n=1 Tax=Puccinia coronata f. sp. avenae TaxID=200324 RepID=A0A2N5TDK8_9BASI|nr:hypothetical protein PCASD_13628 [Puccinia coronata f. sp. avenae]PLW32773.1 hypothetical protein PCANC_17351 [Puccinia coronata f. sp. avenae]